HVATTVCPMASRRLAISCAIRPSSSTTRILCFGLCGMLRKSDAERGTAAAIDFERAFELAGQDFPDFKSQRLGFVDGDMVGHADAVVVDGEENMAIRVAAFDQHRAGARPGERVLEGVRDQLVQNEAQWDGAIDAEWNWFDSRVPGNPRGI